MRRLLVIGIALIMLAPACTREERPRARLLRFLSATELSAREFTYRERTQQDGKDKSITVSGSLEDDFKVRALLREDGKEVMEQIIADDSIAVRIADPTKVAALQTPLVGGSQLVTEALFGGRWVMDYAGAPPMLAPKTRDGVLDVGKNHVLDAVYVFQYLRRAIQDAREVFEFNPDSVEYISRDDPFEKPEKGSGVERYDLLAPPLPRRSQRGTSAALPGISHFRKMAFFVQQGRVFKVQEHIDFETHPDFLRVKEGKNKTKFLQQMLAAVRAGKTREPLRLRFMTLELSRIGSDEVKVTAPADFLAADLGTTFGPRGLSGVAGAAPALPPAGGSTATTTSTETPSG